jgi:hypothetical protein
LEIPDTADSERITSDLLLSGHRVMRDKPTPYASADELTMRRVLQNLTALTDSSRIGVPVMWQEVILEFPDADPPAPYCPLPAPPEVFSTSC